MDDAVRFHLNQARSGTVNAAPMFWITDQNNEAALKFSDEYKIRQIIYSPANNHSELFKVVEELNSGTSVDAKIEKPGFAYLPKIDRSVRNLDSVDFSKLDSNVIRELLNKKACEILQGGSEMYQRYEEFFKHYRREIHSAWYIEEGEKLLNLSIGREIGDGAFGRVFYATDRDGNELAVKLLKEDVMRKQECLQSFRRGVKAMEILSQKDVDGVVKFKFSSEIPALVAMEYVDGASLYDVVAGGFIPDWKNKLRILTETCKIIKSAHALPERVLHRDIRPQNIILRGYDYHSKDWSVCVLDFDLAFHKGANEVSMQMAGGVNGYLAPEQIDGTPGSAERRSSRVDSYGFAMLCYFVITGKTPRPDQCLQDGWKELLKRQICSCECEQWESLPLKMYEIISCCTEYEQSARMDLYRVYGYLENLKQAYENHDKVKQPELIADEFTFLVAKKANSCRAITKNGDGRRKFLRVDGSSYEFSVEGFELRVLIGWHNDGQNDYQRVKKALFDRVGALVQRVRNTKIAYATSRFEGAGALVEVTYDISSYVYSEMKNLACLLAEYGIAPRTF